MWLYWLAAAGLLTGVCVWIVRRTLWVLQLRRELIGEYDLLDLWLEVIINGKP